MRTPALDVRKARRARLWALLDEDPGRSLREMADIVEAEGFSRPVKSTISRVRKAHRDGRGPDPAPRPAWPAARPDGDGMAHVNGELLEAEVARLACALGEVGRPDLAAHSAGLTASQGLTLIRLHPHLVTRMAEPARRMVGVLLSLAEGEGVPPAVRLRAAAEALKFIGYGTPEMVVIQPQAARASIVDLLSQSDRDRYADEAREAELMPPIEAEAAG